MEIPETVIRGIVGFFSNVPELFIIGALLFLFFRRRNRVSKAMPPFPVNQRQNKSTSILCNNCGLANPSVWEKCERCGAPLGATTIQQPPPDAEVPPLVKKI